MNDILARRARRATVGIALSAALVAGIAPATAIAAETSSPTGAVALQTEDAAAAKEKAYAAMQEALKNLEAAKDAAGPEILETIEHVITDLQSLRDRMLKEADDSRGPLLYLQANVDAAQAKYDEAHDRTSGLQAELIRQSTTELLTKLLSSCKVRSCRQKGEKNLVKMIFTAANAGSKARKVSSRSSKPMRKNVKPISTKRQPSEMRSSTI